MAFGKRVGGGRRVAPRLRMDLPASVTALEFNGVAILVDVSTTGAKLRGSDFPAEGHDMWIRIGPVDVLGTVQWTEGDQCGVTFDIPLEPYELHQLRSEGDRARFTRLTPEQRLAAEDWTGGLAR